MSEGAVQSRRWGVMAEPQWDKKLQVHSMPCSTLHSVAA